MGTVKYTGPIASFHCPTEATIRSLKVHFSPKQEGSGDPSPENVRPIVGWEGVEAHIGYEYLSNVQNTTNKTLNSSGEEITENGMTVTDYISVTVGHTYTLKFTSTTAGRTRRIFGYSSSKTPTSQLASVSWATVGNVITMNAEIPMGTSFIKVCYYNNDINKTLTELSSDTNINYEFGVLGKNKFDYANADIVNRKRLDDNGNEVSDATGSYCKLKIPVIPNKEYILSGYTASSSKRIYYYNIDGDFISRSDTYSGSSFTFTTLSDCYYIQIQLNEESTSGWDTMQLELGSTATAYEPYDPNKTVYGGWVDLITGEVQQEYDKIILDGSYNPGLFPWGTDAEDETGTIITHALYLKRDTYDNRHKRDAGAYCDQLQWYNINNVRNKIGFGMYDGSSYSACLMLPKELIGDTTETLNSYLSENPITIVSELETPIAYQLAPIQMQTFLAQNNVWSNADYVEVEYDLHETQNILARKQYIMASQPHVESASGAIASFETDMAAPVKECKVHFSPVQEGEGDPSQENVRAISGWNNINLYRTGKNLINENYLIDANNYPNAGNYGYYYTNDIQLIPNTRYRFVWYNYDNTALSEFGATSINLYVQGASEYIVNNANYRQYSSGFLTPSTGIIRFGIYHPSSLQRQDILNAIFNNGKLLLQIGTDDTAYESYFGTTLPIDWTDNAGTVYGGYVDLINGEVVQEWETVKIADLNWYNYSGKIHYYTNLPSRERNTYIYTDTLTPRTTGSFTQETVGELTYYGEGTTATYKYIWTKVPEAMESTEANEWIKNTYADAIICYKLETPIHYTLTPTQLKSLRGTNNIWSSTNGNIEVKYWTH